MKSAILLITALAGTPLVLAEPLELDYASLYSHTRQLDDEQLDALQFAFGFKHHQKGHLCGIESAYIHTPKQDIPVRINNEQRFVVPSEKALKLAKAVVRFELAEPVNQCDMSVQLETKPQYLKSRYDLEELRQIFIQYQTFFDDMGGFLSFMMPSVQGLKLQFGTEVTGQPSMYGLQPPALQNHQLNLNEAFLQGQGSIDLPAAPLRITAITQQD